MRCNGDHRMPPCDDKYCWHKEPLDDYELPRMWERSDFTE